MERVVRHHAVIMVRDQLVDLQTIKGILNKQTKRFLNSKKNRMQFERFDEHFEEIFKNLEENFEKMRKKSFSLLL